LTPKRSRKKNISQLKDEARAALSGALPATDVAISDPPTIEGLGDWFPIMVRVVGPDLAEVNKQAQFVADFLKKTPGTADVRIEANPPKPELTIDIDRVRASDLGLSAAQIATQMRLAIQGDVAAKLREGKDETDIRVRLAERDRQNPERIRTMDLFSQRGQRKLSDVARVELRDGPSVIEHEDRERQIAVYSQMATGAALGDIALALRKVVAQHKMLPGYSVKYDGQIKTLDEQNSAFSGAFGLAFVFIFMVLASQFESLKHPFTIMVSLPLALIGALLGLLIAGKHLSLGAMIGVILLMGLVTKNAILLVDGALQNLREGHDVHTALMKAGPRRLRPILMTSFAMAIGMVPTAIGTGMGSEFRSPMAVAVIGGVITSTMLTLLVVPVVFYFFEKPYLMVEPFVRLLRFVTGRKAPVLVSAERQPEQAASARV
jgi:multidrug efflux pump subunit AcrB